MNRQSVNRVSPVQAQFPYPSPPPTVQVWLLRRILIRITNIAPLIKTFRMQA